MHPHALLADALSPIGAVGALIVGDWNYPLWIWLRDLLAYALSVGGAVLGLRWKPRALLKVFGINERDGSCTRM